MLNQSVRNESKRLAGWSGNLAVDDRYMRVKQRAVELVPRLLSDYGMPDVERDMFARALLGKTLEAAA